MVTPSAIMVHSCICWKAVAAADMICSCKPHVCMDTQLKCLGQCSKRHNFCLGWQAPIYRTEGRVSQSTCLQLEFSSLSLEAHKDYDLYMMKPGFVGTPNFGGNYIGKDIGPQRYLSRSKAIMKLCSLAKSIITN